MNNSNKAFDEIMESITAEFTGDWDHDKRCLRKKMEMYKNHPLSKEVLRACGRLMWEMVPEELRSELEQTMDNHRSATESTLNEVSYNIKAGNSAKALAIIEPLARKMDDLLASGWCADDTESRYFNFRSPIDEVVWHAHNNESRDIRQATEPFDRVYFMLGSCLFEAGRHEEALVACSKAVRWNPADVGLRFELAENYKRLRDMDGYARVVQELYPYVASADELGHYHRAMGYLCVELGSFRSAAAHLMASLLFDNSSLPLSEVMYIKMQYGQDYTDMTPQAAIGVLEEIGDPLLIDNATFKALNQLLGTSFRHGDLQTTLQVAVELYNLTRNEEYEKLARSLVDALENVEKEG